MYVQRKTQDKIDEVGQPSQSGRAAGGAGERGRGGRSDSRGKREAGTIEGRGGRGESADDFRGRRQGYREDQHDSEFGAGRGVLAGQVYQDNAVAPTRAANIFFARGTVFVEAGGALMANPQSWTSLVKKLAPSRLKSMGASGQAPRGVLLCFDLETFTRAGAGEAITNATRYLQARLGEISEILGNQLSGVRAVHASRQDSIFRGVCPQFESGRSGAGGGRDRPDPVDGGRAASTRKRRRSG